MQNRIASDTSKNSNFLFPRFFFHNTTWFSQTNLIESDRNEQLTIRNKTKNRQSWTECRISARSWPRSTMRMTSRWWWKSRYQWERFRGAKVLRIVIWKFPEPQEHRVHPQRKVYSILKHLAFLSKTYQKHSETSWKKHLSVVLIARFFFST